MIIGTGVDIVDKTRVASAMEKLGLRFVRRILTENEILLIPSKNREVEYIAGRFAAKEAFAKATGFGIGEKLSFLDIEIERDDLGKPALKMKPEWLQQHFPDKDLKLHVSISHEKKYAIAQVILEG